MKRVRTGVRTAKRAARTTTPIEFKLAEQDTWQPARLFSVAGIGGAGEEQERRATSALVATMQAVPAFARAVCSRVGAPPPGVSKAISKFPTNEANLVSFPMPSSRFHAAVDCGPVCSKSRPVTASSSASNSRTTSMWLVGKKYDAVISLSNDIPPASAGELPVEVDRRKLAKVALRHLSWAEVAHEARMLLSHGHIEENLQNWILREFLRYLDHPRSGGFRVRRHGPSLGSGTRSRDCRNPAAE